MFEIHPNMSPMAQYRVRILDLFRRLRNTNLEGIRALQAAECLVFGKTNERWIDERLVLLANHFGSTGYIQAQALIFEMAKILFGINTVESLYLEPTNAVAVVPDYARIYSKIFSMNY